MLVFSSSSRISLTLADAIGKVGRDQVRDHFLTINGPGILPVIELY